MSGDLVVGWRSGGAAVVDASRVLGWVVRRGLARLGADLGGRLDWLHRSRVLGSRSWNDRHSLVDDAGRADRAVRFGNLTSWRRVACWMRVHALRANWSAAWDTRWVVTSSAGGWMRVVATISWDTTCGQSTARICWRSSVRIRLWGGMSRIQRWVRRRRGS